MFAWVRARAVVTSESRTVPTVTYSSRPRVALIMTELIVGVGESNWGQLVRRRWRTRLELANAIFEYLEIFHNRQRRHSAIGWLTPLEFESTNRSLWPSFQQPDSTKPGSHQSPSRECSTPATVDHGVHRHGELRWSSRQPRVRPITASDRRTTPARADSASAAPGSDRANEMTTPRATIVMMSADPPEDTSGRGTPMTGRSPMTTPMLMNAWPMIQVAIAPVVICTNGSG